MTNKKRAIITAALIASVVIIVALGVLYMITEAFAVSTILHAYMRILCVLLIVKCLQKCFKNEIQVSMKKMLIFTSAVLFLDLVVVDAVRFVLRGGISTILFFPACLPAAFMIIMHYMAKDSGKDRKAEEKICYVIGIPLLLLGLYFEVISFM